MGMKRETYERKFKELFADITELVDKEVDRWRDYKIEVRKNQVSPTKFVYVVEWRGRPLNAFVLEFRKDNSGYPYILLYYDHRTEEIYRIHRKIGEKEASLIMMLRYFIEETIHLEAKRVSLQEGFFAGIKGGDLIVHIGDYEFRLEYWQNDNIWRVRCDELRIDEKYKCGDCHPLEFLSGLLRALVLRHLL
jgi:hypothetical protein